MDTQSVTVDPKRFTDGESGAIGGMTPLDRTNRIDFLANGLGALAVIFDSAMRAPDEHQSTPMVWGEALYLVGMIAKDIHFESSALWEEVRPLVQAAKAGAA